MLRGSWQIGRIMGIPVKLHFSWFVIFGLITWALATRYFPQVAPELPQATNWLRAALAALLLFISVTIHELSHSFVAIKNKIPITSITLFIFGGIARMKKEPSSPGVELRMALAGPFSSYILAVIFFVFYKSSGDYGGLKAIAYYLFQLNVILGTFNLIPGFPMDGGRVLRALLWQKSGDYLSATKKASKTGQGFALFFIFSGLASLLTGYAGGVWFLLIGWFLYTAAQSSYRQAETKGILAGVKVRDVMTGDVITVSADISVPELVDNYFLRYGYGGFPVMDGEKLAGIVGIKAIRGMSRDRWINTSARDVMQALDASLTVSADDDISVIFEKMIKENKARFAVMDNGRLVGLITRSGIARYLHMKGELEGRK